MRAARAGVRTLCDLPRKVEKAREDVGVREPSALAILRTNRSVPRPWAGPLPNARRQAIAVLLRGHARPGAEGAQRLPQDRFAGRTGGGFGSRHMGHQLALLARVMLAGTRPHHSYAEQLIAGVQGKRLDLPAEAALRLVQVDVAVMRTQLDQHQIGSGEPLR